MTKNYAKTHLEGGTVNRKVNSRGPTLTDNSGHSKFIEQLVSLCNVDLFVGVNGGGVIHTTKYAEPYDGLHQAHDGVTRFLDIPEAVATNLLLGYNFASDDGKAAGMFTTGGATFYAMLGPANAKAHNIPGIYIFALNSTKNSDRGPLQDMTPAGANSVEIVRALLRENCLVIKRKADLEKRLIEAQRILSKSQPVAFMFHPDVLSEDFSGLYVPRIDKPREVDKKDLGIFMRDFPREIERRRVVLFAGEEAAIEAASHPEIKDYITNLASLLKAPVIYSQNGASAVAHNNPYAAGHIHLGFNDWTKQLWDSLSRRDIVVFLGFDPGEYELNLGNIKADVWHFTNLTNPYGSKRSWLDVMLGRDGNFRHRVDGKYRRVKVNMALALEYIIPELGKRITNRPNFFDIPENLNSREIEEPGHDYVDLAKFYREYAKLVRAGTLIVNDVCQAYKDSQYIIQRPINGVRRFDLHRFSTMGDAFGFGLGVKLGNPNLFPHIFAGDGCFRYFDGALGNAQHLGLTVWVIDNRGYHIVGEGLKIAIPNVDPRRYHSNLPPNTQPIDFVGKAKASGWDAVPLEPNLDNLEEIMGRSYSGSTKSMLVNMRVDRKIIIGQNPRLLGLRAHGVKTYL